MLRVYYASILGLPDSGEGMPLSEYRKNKLNRLRTEQGRKQSIGAELLLIRALLELDRDFELPLRIEADTFGKPHLSDSAPFFNLSHSGDFVACALADVPLGLDLQKKSPYREKMVSRFFSADEKCQILSAEDADDAFTEIWTKKESYLKAVGCGIRVPLNSFSSLCLPDGYCCWHTMIGEYHLSLCSRGFVPIPGLIKEETLP